MEVDLSIQMQVQSLRKKDLIHREKITGGNCCGGRRIGSGRSIGTTKEPKKRVSLPSDIADWIVMPDTILHLRALGIPHKQG